MKFTGGLLVLITVLFLSANTDGKLTGVDSEVTRDSVISRLKKRIQHKIPLVVHVMVPLCDNEHQGIVPVNSSLGNGMNLKTNLYWGAGYGIRSFFKKQIQWKFITDTMISSDSMILQRSVFQRSYMNGAVVYLVADAYRGDAMKRCMHDFIYSLAGSKTDSFLVHRNLKTGIYGNADLIVFNGHNGLMDESIDYAYCRNSGIREGAVIACYSYSYFAPYFAKANAYPLLTTNGLLAPEAYVLSALIDNWAETGSGSTIRNAAADAYHKKHPSSSRSACLGLFRTGWKR